MFWGLIMEPNKRYTQTVEKAFHLSMASLDASTAIGGSLVQVMICYDNRNYLLCTLQKGSIWQVPLDLNFQEGTKIAFTCNGDGHVHLTGYLIPENDGLDEIDDLEEDEEEEEDEEIPQLIGIKKRKAPSSPKDKNDLKKAKKAKVEEDDDDDESDSDDEDGDLGLTNMLNDSDDDDDDEEDDEDDDDEEDEDDSDEDEEEEEEEETPVKLTKKEKQKQKQQQQNHQQNQQNQQGKKEKNKLVNGKEQGKPEKEQGKQKKNKDDSKTENKSEQPQQQKKRTIEGGVQVEDIKVGGGAPAKPGKFVSVYYIGRLKNGKKFDQTQQGEGFKFRLGKGEVIKGWDVGIAGMKVGGKRRITIPPNMGYGAKGSPPVIPPNSQLNFEVELKAIH